MIQTGRVLQESNLKRLGRWTSSSGGLTILVTLAFLIGMTALKGPFILMQSLIVGGMWALIAVGLSIVFGVMNIVSFVHGEFFMIGGLVAYTVYTPINNYLKVHPSAWLQIIAPFFGIVASIIVGAILGIIIERILFYPLRKKSESQWIMNAYLVTVGLSVILINGVQLVVGPNYKGISRYWDVEPLRVFGLNVPVDRVVIFSIGVITLALFWYFLSSTKTGRGIRAVSQDEIGAQMVGINLNSVYILTFGLSTALAAMAGAVLLSMFPFNPTVGLKPLYIAWFVVILAGLGNVEGAIIGGFIVAFLQTLSSTFIGIGWEDVVPTLLMIIILLVRPSGLFGSEVKGIHEK